MNALCLFYMSERIGVAVNMDLPRTRDPCWDAVAHRLAISTTVLELRSVFLFFLLIHLQHLIIVQLN